MTVNAASLRASSRAQTERKLQELNTLTPTQLVGLRHKRMADSQRLAYFYQHVRVMKESAEPLLPGQDATKCWAWTGNSKPDSQGNYPVMSSGKGKCGHAIAWAYKHIRGLQLPTREEGLELSHQCEENGLGSSCTNPYHAEKESRSENMLRVPEVKRKARMARARSFKKCHQKKNSNG